MEHQLSLPGLLQERASLNAAEGAWREAIDHPVALDEDVPHPK